jgi:hypothetical protein
MEAVMKKRIEAEKRVIKNFLYAHIDDEGVAALIKKLNSRSWAMARARNIRLAPTVDSER